GGVDYFAVGLADDGQEHFMWALNTSVLQCVDGERFETAGAPGRFFMNAPYAMQILHDGTQVRLISEGNEVSLGAGARTSGAIFLRGHCEDPVRVTQLVIEGHLVPESFARLRRARVERELATF